MKNNVEGFTNRTKINQEAAEWVLLLEDTPKLSKKQIADLNAWVATSDIHRECIETMVNSWGEMDLLSSVMLAQEMRKPSTISRLATILLFPFIAIYSFILTITKQKKVLFKPGLYASLLLGGVIYVSVFYLPVQPDQNGLVLTTKVGERLNHTMPDGSTIYLNSSTKVIVSFNDEFRRINLLTGEAHFEVAKDPNRPFEVYAEDRLIRAIGTAFSVHKLNGNIEVLVSEGVVELAIIDNTLVVIPDDFKAVNIEEHVSDKAGKLSKIIKINSKSEPASIKKQLGKLTAGQRLMIPIQEDTLSHVDELDNSEVTRYLSWKDGKLVFAGEPLEEVIQEVTRHTQVKIDVLDPKLKTMRIGGQFQVGETDTLFYVLESGFGISVDKLNEDHVQLRIKEKINGINE